MEINIGVSEPHRKAIAEGLSRVLADSYTLYLKTLNFHWNVTGPQFHTLHAMFEEQYLALAPAIDEIAERIRALGEFAPGSYAAFSELTSIEEATGVPSSTDMVKQLLAGQETVVRVARELLDVVGEASDEPSADLLTQRIQYHEKTAWMLRSLLQAS